MKNLVLVNDGFAEDAKENADRAIRGLLLKFTKGHWTVGPDDEPVPPSFRAVAIETKAAWVKWVDGKPEHIWRTPSNPLPPREDLPDQDKTLWEIGADGQPKDPWQLTKYMFLVNPETAEQFTFSTHTWGGRIEIGDLCEKIELMRTARPGACPIVELDVNTYRVRKRPDIDPVPKPVFKIVGWVGGNGNLTPALPANTPVLPASDAVSEPTTGELLDDEVPY